MQLRNLFISQLKNVCQLILIQATLKRPKGQNLASALGGPRTVSLVFLDQQRSPATFIGRCSYWNQSLFELLRRGTRMSFFQSLFNCFATKQCWLSLARSPDGGQPSFKSNADLVDNSYAPVDL